MKRQVYKYDSSGFYVEPLLIGQYDLLPPNCVETAPTSDLYKAKWNGSDWLEGATDAELLINAKAAKIGELNNAFVSALYQGFDSAADGTTRHYAFDPNNQRLLDWLLSIVTAGTCPDSIMAKDATGSQVTLTPTQAKQLCMDAQNHYLPNYQKLCGYEKTVSAATTIDAVNGVVWS